MSNLNSETQTNKFYTFAKYIHFVLMRIINTPSTYKPLKFWTKPLNRIKKTIAICIVLVAYLVRDFIRSIKNNPKIVSNITVIHVPDYTSTNVYQKLLSNNLKNSGVTVQFVKPSGYFSLLIASVIYWKPQIIHIHWQHPFLLGSSKANSIFKSTIFILELFILKIIGIKLVWTTHNLINHEKKFENIEKYFTRLLSYQCDGIIVHSQSAKTTVQSVFKIKNCKKIFVIPHGNYLGCYANHIDRKKAREKLGFSNSDFIFLFFGLIRPYKGVLELIEVFENLEFEHIKLVIAGKPVGTNNILKTIQSKSRVNKNIYVKAEFISDNEIQVFMNASDVMVLPYKDIFTSGSAVLAMSFGKPIIAPSIGCIPDMVDSKGCFFYNPSDETGLLKAMQSSLHNNLGNMGEHNLRLAKKLQWHDVGEKTYEVYLRCLNKAMINEY